jgi:hypothetical protein
MNAKSQNQDAGREAKEGYETMKASQRVRLWLQIEFLYWLRVSDITLKLKPDRPL